MTQPNRRNLLAVAGAGAAVGTVGLTTGTAFASEAAPRTGRAKEPVVAYIKDHRAAELVVMLGDREVVVHDRDLVTRILNAAGGK